MNMMTPPDLFSQIESGDDSAIVPQDAEQSLTRAKNAALQKPLSYLEAERSRIGTKGVAVFEVVSHIQALQYFLQIVAHAMVYDTGGGLEISHGFKKLVEFIAVLDCNKRLDEDHYKVAANAIIDALKNCQGGNRKFIEEFMNPVTGKLEKYKFHLLYTATKSQTETDVTVYRLTDQGAKLMYINWANEDDPNAEKLIIDDYLRRGEYKKANVRLHNHMMAASRIIAKICDIRAMTNSLVIEPEKRQELIESIKEADELVKAYWNDSDLYDESLRKGDQSDEDLRRLRISLGQIREITARMRRECMLVFEDIHKMECRKLNLIGIQQSLIDVRVDVLEPLSLINAEVAYDRGLPTATMAALFQAKARPVFDPFLFFEIVKVEKDEDDEDPEESVPDTLIENMKPEFSIRELKQFDDLIRSYIFRSPAGVTLSELYFLVEENSSLNEREKLAVMHFAAMFGTNPNTDLAIAKEPTGELISNRFVQGEDIRLRPVGA